MATTTFDNLITFSRGSNATVTGPNGLIQWAPNNLATNSQDMEAAAWVKSNSTVTANAAAAPDGTQTADTWIPTSTATAAGVRLLGTFTTVSGTVQTASIYIKSAGKRWVYMTTPAAATNNDNCWFDLQNGVVGTIGSSAISATMTAVGNGWFRITTTSNTASPTNYIFISTTTGDNTTAVTADGTGIQVWGAQLELGSTATAYNNTSVRNLLGFSEAFDNAAWTKTRASVVTGAQANPVNGLFSAQKLMEDTSTNSHFTSQTVTCPSIPQTISVYAKSSGRDIRINLSDNTTGNASCFFNLTTGSTSTLATTGSWSAASATITNLGSGWYRCSLTATRGAGTQTVINYELASGISASYTGDGSSGAFLYGAQLSNSASLDPYVPTPGAAPSSTVYYGPRFDYDPVTLLPRGLLVEEARTNLLTYSEQFDNAAWSEANVGTISPGTFTAPDGTATADRMVATVGAGAHTVFTTTAPTTATGVNHAWTVYVKKDAYRFVYLCQSASSNNNITAVFDLDGVGSTATQTNVGSGSGTIASTSIQNVGNGWFRISLVGAVTGASRFCAIGFAAAATGNTINVDGNVTFTAAGTEAVLIWGAQLEVGPFATSYIPTIASTVTRSADVATITGSLFSQWYSSAAGTFIADFQTIQSGVMAATSYVLAMDTSGSKRIIYIASGADVATTFDGTTIIGAVGDVTGSPAKVASAYDASGRAIVANNGAVATGAVVSTYAASTSLNIGSLGGGQSLGWLRSIRYVPVRAADFQLQQVTT